MNMMKTIKLTQKELLSLVSEAYHMGIRDMERVYEPFYYDDDSTNHLDLVLKLWNDKTKK